MNSIELRLQALEKANRRYKQILFSVAVVTATLAFMAFNNKKPAPDLIQAKTFEVVNDQGKVLVRMNTLDGSGRVTTFNPSGEKQLDLLPNKAGGGSFRRRD